MNPILWEPTAAQREATRLTAFTKAVERKTGQSFSSYSSLWQWSVDYPEKFWPAVWDFCRIRAMCPWEQVLVDGHKMPGARWFEGAKLNFAENLLGGKDADVAILFRNERGERREMTFAALRDEVARLTQWLRRCGVAPGDRVAAWTPNIPETVVMLLAAATVGATFSSCSPDFGTQAVVERLGQIEPTILLVADGYTYGGKSFQLLPKVQQLLKRIESIRKIVVVPYLTATPECEPGSNFVFWNDIPNCELPIEFESLPFDHPLYILYSSGTTGRPKCIVHSAGGTLLQHLKEHQLHTDLQAGNKIFYFTTCGWMMWNWLVSGLASQATIVLYDGSPTKPDVDVLFRMADEEDIHIFGTSASYLAAIEKAGVVPKEKYPLSAVRTVLSTGSPLSDESFEYVYKNIKSDLCLSSISGGTDIISCFSLGNPNLRVRRGELQCRGLGMACDIYDSAGKPIREEKGELVCTKPFPSMPIGFWRDDENRRYKDAYFARYPSVWCHGDFALLTDEGGMVIYGRSDAILNPGGVRIGTAEIYAQVMQIPQVVDCVAVGQDWKGDTRVVLFVQLGQGAKLDEPLREKICQKLRSNASPRHVPEVIIAVADIPKTRSGKTAELAVRNAIHGRPVDNLDALSNPEALEGFSSQAELA